MTDEIQAQIENVKRDARTFLETLKAAVDAGVPQAVLMPELLVILRESGMMPETGMLSSLGGMLGR